MFPCPFSEQAEFPAVPARCLPEEPGFPSTAASQAASVSVFPTAGKSPLNVLNHQAGRGRFEAHVFHPNSARFPMAERGVAEEMAQALATVRDASAPARTSGYPAPPPCRCVEGRHTPGAAALFAPDGARLRGSAGTLGFTEVVRFATELEKLAEGESPAFSSRVPTLFRCCQEAFAHPPAPWRWCRTGPAWWCGWRTRRSPTSFAPPGRARHGRGAAPSDEDAVRLLTSDRPVERVVMGPALSPALRAAHAGHRLSASARSAGRPPRPARRPARAPTRCSRWAPRRRRWPGTSPPSSGPPGALPRAGGG